VRQCKEYIIFPKMKMVKKKHLQVRKSLYVFYYLKNTHIHTYTLLQNQNAQMGLFLVLSTIFFLCTTFRSTLIEASLITCLLFQKLYKLCFVFMNSSKSISHNIHKK
jgi:hypothetical protein